MVLDGEVNMRREFKSLLSQYSQWVALVILIFVPVMAKMVLYPQYLGSDDDYIHLRFANNLLQTGQFAYNPGEPTYGTTSPLWVMLLALIAKCNTHHVEVSARLLSSAFAVASVLMFYVLARRFIANEGLRVFATLVFSTDPWLLKWTGTALEGTLTAFLVMLSVGIRFSKNRDRVWMLAPLLFAVATLARPEVILLFVLLEFILWCQARFRAYGLVRLLVAAAIYGLTLMPWLVCATRTFGTPIPNTFLAKTIAGSHFHISWALRVARYFTLVLGATYGVELFSIALFVGVLLLIKRKLPDFEYLVPLSWGLGLVSFYTLSNLQTPSTRYSVALIPWIILLGVASVERLLPSQPKVRRALLASAACFLIVISSVVVTALFVYPYTKGYAQSYVEPHRTVAEWLADNTSVDTKVAVMIDIGVIGYYSNRYILDLGGLITPQALEFEDRTRFMELVRPEYLVVTGEREKFSMLRFDPWKTMLRPVLSVQRIEEMVWSQQASFVSVYRVVW
jgi:hypothetical protein